MIGLMRLFSENDTIHQEAKSRHRLLEGVL